MMHREAKMNNATENSGLIRLDPADNVAVATKPLKRGDAVELGGHTLLLAQDIPAGHKIAVGAAQIGESIVKYGQPIGLVTNKIRPGDHVHTQNLTDHHVVSDDLSEINPPPSPERISRTFDGFCRPDGRVGTRNYVAVVSTNGPDIYIVYIYIYIYTYIHTYIHIKIYIYIYIVNYS